MNPVGDLKSNSQRELEVVEGKISQHEARVAALKAALASLDHERRSLDEERNATLPISKLPVEVMTDIFALVCEKIPFYSLRRAEIPKMFVIGRICRAWRRVAWSAPQLWSDISLSFSATRHVAQMELLQQWLARTADRKLYVEIGYSKAELLVEPPIQIFELLLQTCDRWESLTLVALENFFKAYEQRAHPRLSSLKSLSIRRTLFQNQRGLPTWVFKLDRPLDRLDLSNGFRKRNLDIDWAHLCALDVMLSLEDCIAALRECKMLETCSLILNQSSIGVPEDILLPHVTYLSVAGQAAMVSALLRSLRTPRLDILNLEVNCNSQNHIWIPGLIEMVKEKPFPLTTLSLYEDRFTVTLEGVSEGTSEEELLGLFQLLPTIQTLELKVDSPFILSDTLIGRLSLAPEGAGHTNRSDCLPQLRSFSFLGDISFNLKTLLSTLKSRAISKSQSSDNDHSRSIRAPQSKFCTEITYRNREWFSEGDPNDFHDFYQGLEALRAGWMRWTLSFPWRNNLKRQRRWKYTSITGTHYCKEQIPLPCFMDSPRKIGGQ